MIEIPGFGEVSDDMQAKMEHLRLTHPSTPGSPIHRQRDDWHDYWPNHEQLLGTIELFQAIQRHTPEEIDLHNLYVETCAYEGQIDREMGISPRRHRKTAPPKSGYIYLVQDTQNYTKIGRTVNWKQRLNPAEWPPGVTTRFIFKVKDHVRVEKELHEKYSDSRVKGEWFQLSEDDIQAIYRMYQSTVIQREQ